MCEGGEIIGNVPTIEELAVYIKDYIKNDVYGSEWGTDIVNGATRKVLYDIIQSLVVGLDILPIGTILMYDGTGIAEVETREVEIGAHGSDTIEMFGWFVCNGLVSTPNIVNCFIRGHYTSSTMGGSNDAVVVEHTHGITDPTHAHDVKEFGETFTLDGDSRKHLDILGSFTAGYINSKATGITVNNEGVSGVAKNMPKYYSVIFIIKMS